MTVKSDRLRDETVARAFIKKIILHNWAKVCIVEKYILFVQL